MKKLFILSTLLILFFAFGCNKEEAITPSAEFSTNLENNTAKKGRAFTVYLDKTSGEFLVYFKGNNEQNTYSADDPARIGTSISVDLDSVSVPGYNSVGEFVFTVVASSSGNWAKDYVQDIKSITIKVEE